MNPVPAPAGSGRIASLHLHPMRGGEAFQCVESVEVLAGKGIRENPRYFDRGSRRQVSLMEREQIAAHAAALGVATFPPGAVRANIETTGLTLTALVGEQVQIGDAILLLYALRDPCAKMDTVARGLRELMDHGRQGVLAQVVRSGNIRVGARIHLVKAAAAS